MMRSNMYRLRDMLVTIMVIVIFFQVIPPDFPSTGSDMQPSGDEASGCTCGDEGQVEGGDHVVDHVDGVGHDDGDEEEPTSLSCRWSTLK